MEVPDRFRSPSVLRRFWRAPFQFSLLLTAVLSAKLLHLYSHALSIPILLYILYMPTFLALDAINAFTFWVIVHLSTPGRLWIPLALFRGLFCMMILGVSSIQIAFYVETGGEIKWGAAKSLASDPDGFKVALTGGVQAMFVAFIIIVVSFLISQPLYNVFQVISGLVLKAFANRKYQALCRNGGDIVFTDQEAGYASSSSEEDMIEQDHCLSTSRVSVEQKPLLVNVDDLDCKPRRRWIARLIFIVPALLVGVLAYVRPRSFPYPHLSNTLPFTLMELWNPFDRDMCQAGHFKDFPDFPLETLVAEELWESANGNYVGWRPIANMTVAYQNEHHVPRPLWLPDKPIQGLSRWYQPPRDEHLQVTSEGIWSEPGPGPGPPPPPPPHGRGFHSRHPPGPPPQGRKHGQGHRHGREGGFKGRNYDPVTDPLRVSNLDHDVLMPIIDALKTRDIKIKHLVLLALESTRKDVFPFKKDSLMHEKVIKSYGSVERAAEASEALSKLTPNSEILTGEASGFYATKTKPVTGNETWRGLEADRGGLNIQGAFTGSTTSLKSMLESHCGVQPLAVDFTVEASRKIYQPCIPAILKLFNDKKGEGSPEATERDGSFNSMPWRSVYVQAITDQFDHQDELNQQVGFEKIIVKKTLLDPESKYSPPTEKQSNYFGFPEKQVKPYLEDLFREAEKTGERLFLSHLTSTTHHPWNLPESAGPSIDYLKRGAWRGEHELNRYLNTIKYIDGWIGEILDLLHDTGVGEETLVVMVGDHGMAFEEDSSLHSTFENGHISNMRVPLNFFHPSLPRIQLEVNATSLSIIPTILDLLVTTSSLNKDDSAIATDLLQQYEGQSLIRPFQKEKNGRQAWNIGVLNAGGALLSISSAAFPYRLILPICKAGAYRFTANDLDPHEAHPVEANSISELVGRVSKTHTDKAAAWVEQAEKIGKWWVLEQRRRWRFDGASLQDDRRPEDLRGAGAEKKAHWWDT